MNQDQLPEKIANALYENTRNKPWPIAVLLWCGGGIMITVSAFFIYLGYRIFPNR